jgi:hypothetical protein
VCEDRNDDWAVAVRGRIESINDLHAADASYHQTCSVNFRTSKALPKAFSPDSKAEGNRGRPRNFDKEYHFQKVIEYLQENRDGQIAIKDLVNMMNDFCAETVYSPVHLKRKLKDHFGDNIIITDINGKSSVVTLRETAKSILQAFYSRPKNEDPEDQKKAIILAAAQLIKSDVQSLKGERDVYPTAREIGSIEANLNFVPQSLQLFLQNLSAEKKSDLKVSSIGQSIMQIIRPRTLLSPLQIGLGVQLHHSFASRFLISTLHNLGFCSSYSEVQRFESNAAISQGLDIPGDVTHSFLQYVADNVDHNLRTLDGNNTFHGMGIICGITPGTIQQSPIRRKVVSAEEIKSIARIEIEYYKQSNNSAMAVTFEELENIRNIDNSACVDFLSLAVWPLINPTPGWSGVMQMTQQGEYPGKSSVHFLPMIDMNASDLSCVYSTLLFVCKEAGRYQRTPILTFDQPLFWKAMMIVWNEPKDSKLRSINGHTFRSISYRNELSRLYWAYNGGIWFGGNVRNNLCHKHSTSHAER